jgi:hypothetical protein
MSIRLGGQGGLSRQGFQVDANRLLSLLVQSFGLLGQGQVRPEGVKCFFVKLHNKKSPCKGGRVTLSNCLNALLMLL